jgi:hypothetical protein
VETFLLVLAAKDAFCAQGLNRRGYGFINSFTMRTVVQESYADRVRRERKGEGMESVEQLPQIDWTSEPATFDAIFPQRSDACEEPGFLNESSNRKFRLSRSPLDSLQMEFKRYGKSDIRANDIRVCPSSIISPFKAFSHS